MARPSRIALIASGIALSLLAAACNTVPSAEQPALRVAAKIEVEEPGTLVLDPPAGMLYLVSENAVHFIDTKTRKVDGKLELGGSVGWNTALDSDRRVLYVPNVEDKSVMVVDLESRELVANIPAGEMPVSVTLDARANLLFVANHAWDEEQSLEPSLVVVDTMKREAVAEIPIGVTVDNDTETTNLGDLILDADAGTLYVRGAVMSIVDTRKLEVVRRVGGLAETGFSVLDRTAGALFLTDEEAGAVFAFDTAEGEVLDAFDLESPGELILDEAGHVLYATSLQGESVLVIDTRAREVIGQIDLNDYMILMGGVVDADRKRLYLFHPGGVSEGDADSDAVVVVDTKDRRVTDLIPVGAEELSGIRTPDIARLFLKGQWPVLVS